MARVTSNQKVYRVIEFLLGLRDPRVNQALVPYGLSQRELSIAHQLVRAATEPRLAHRPGAAVSPALLERLDAIDNHWFPIIKFALVRHFSPIAEWVFLNLSQSEGADLVVSLGTLFSRVRQLADGSSPFGEEGKEAFALLQERGLTDDVLADIDQQLASVEQFETPVETFDPEVYEEAVDKLWAWYLEWGGIARTVIKNRRVLRSLGFLRPKGSPAPTPEEEAEEAAEAEESENPTNSAQSGEQPAVSSTPDASAAVA